VRSPLSDTLIAGLWAIDLMGENANNGPSGVNFPGGETGMDGTVPFLLRADHGARRRGRAGAAGLLRHAAVCIGRAGRGRFHLGHPPSNPDFTAYAIKASGFTSVILDNKNANNGVSVTVDLGAAVGSASAVYLQGTPAGTLTAAATTVTLAGAGGHACWRLESPVPVPPDGFRQHLFDLRSARQRGPRARPAMTLRRAPRPADARPAERETPSWGVRDHCEYTLAHDPRRARHRRPLDRARLTREV
jgi:hypothetical protein